jgi:excisionase family DNA binding protein
LPLISSNQQTRGEGVYTSKDVQEKLNVSRITVLRMVDRGEIPAYKVRRDWRFEEKDIEEYLERNRSLVNDQSR